MESQPEEKNETQNKVVQTYAEDMAHFMVENNEAGLVKKIIHEQEEKEEESAESTKERKHNQLVLLSSALVVLLTVGLFGFLVVYREKTSTVPVAEEMPPLIYLDSSSYLDIGGLEKEKIIQLLEKEVEEAELRNGAILGIYPIIEGRQLGLREFFTLLESTLDLKSNEFIREDFLMGMAQNSEKDFFILLKTRSFADIFPTMRAWEGKFFYEMHDLFGIPVNADTNYLATKDWEDSIVQNKNARVLFKNDGTPALMYVFADDNSVIMAQNSMAVKKVLERLASGEIEK